jgi:ParB family chromosome partitioning protein
MKKHLGKGIEALISEVLNEDTQQKQQPVEETEQQKQKDSVVYIDITKLVPSKWQVRKKFDQEQLSQLAESIKQSGIIEPLIVCPLASGNYEIVCGERRWRAAQLVSLQQVPVIIKQLDEQQKHLLSLVENIQRQDLDPIEEASAYKSLMTEFNLTQEQISILVGKDRSVIANTIRILSLPQQVLEYIEDGLITAGHARSLASIKDENTIIDIANKIVNDKLTVRDVELIVKTLKSKKPGSKKLIVSIPEVIELQKQLSELLGTKVVIKPSSNTKGKIIISYNNLDKFDSIVTRLKK